MDAADFPRMGLAESVERLDSMPGFLRDALDAMPPSRLAAAPAPGQFSLLEHACHLRDLEREGYLVRIRRVLSEACPALQPFDGAAVAAARDYPSQDAAAAARDFADARTEAVVLLASLSAAQLGREAAFGDKRLCLADVVAMMVDHDLEHRREIEALLDAREPR